MICLVDSRRHLFNIFCRLLGHLFRPKQIILGPRDHSLYRSWPVLLLIQIQAPDGLLNKGSLIVSIENNKGSIESQGGEMVRLDAQYTGADSMKGANGHLFRLIDPHQLFQPLAHLFSCLICKCDSQDAPRRDVLVLHEIGNTVGDDAGLAASRPCQD